MHLKNQQNTKDTTDEEQGKIGQQLMSLFVEIGQLRELEPTEPSIQEKIAGLQKYITENYYHCTTEILSGLGQMYACDERMKNNIDAAGGEGTAQFVSQAISVYCSKTQK